MSSRLFAWQYATLSDYLYHLLQPATLIWQWEHSFSTPLLGRPIATHSLQLRSGNGSTPSALRGWVVSLPPISICTDGSQTLPTIATRPPQTPPPAYSKLLCISVGSGTQMLMMAGITLVFALLGLMSPARRGGLLQSIMLLFTLAGAVAGYIRKPASASCSMATIGEP
jgi:hypothetical protein